MSCDHHTPQSPDEGRVLGVQQSLTWKSIARAHPETEVLIPTNLPLLVEQLAIVIW